MRINRMHGWVGVQADGWVRLDAARCGDGVDTRWVGGCVAAIYPRPTYCQYAELDWGTGDVSGDE